MCASEPEAWTWMRKVVDFVFERLPIDGVSMQSADQGRCTCERCRVYSDAEYHARLNIRVSDYIRSRWPGKTLAVSGWGMNFGEPSDLAAWTALGGKVDYLIDVQNTSQSRDPAYRRQLIQALACDFGTLGGPQVEPPQHWPRDRWFLPTVKRGAQHLTGFNQDGGRACEYFFHIVENPGDEVSLLTTGRILADPQTPWEKHLQVTVEESYGAGSRVASDLAELFVRAEDAYLGRLSKPRNGTISLEPLEGDRPGPAIYLTKALSAVQRRGYRTDLISIRAGFQKLLPEVPNQTKMRMVNRCLDNVISDAGEG